MPPKPPPKQIKNLSQIDISKMDIAELQNIDYQQILKGILQKPDIAISVGLVILAIFICFNIFTNSQDQRKTSFLKVTELKDKLTVYNQYTDAKNELQEFLKSAPKAITENEFLNTVTDLAVKNKIQIDSFSPSSNNNNPIYNLSRINLSASTSDYANAGLFIKDLENSGFSIRIDKWIGNMGGSQDGGSRTRSQDSDSLINFKIDLSLVTFKE